MSGSLQIVRVSAGQARATVREEDALCMLIDTTTCIGCKACEVACVEWNDLRIEPEYGHRLFQSLQTMPEMTPSFWNLIKFNEINVDSERRPMSFEAANDGTAMMTLMRKDMCMHCAEPGCLIACPAENAIVQYSNGLVDFQQDYCIGCGYCMTGCPFNVPKFDTKSQRVYKCTMCSDRVANGLGPACVKACPTACLEFGTKTEMTRRAEHRTGQVREEGFKHAGVYDPPGVGGAGVIYVLHHADRPELYGQLPRNPRIDPAMKFWKGSLKWMGGFGIGGSIIAAAVHYFATGPRIVEETKAPTKPAREILRYNLFERALHWTVAFTFLYLMFTGLGLYTPKLAWLLSVFGGGQVVRAWHPIIGVVFTGAVLLMFIKWFRDLLITPADRLWLKRIGDYIAGRDKSVPPTDRFNPGQKLTFWSQVLMGLLLLASGVPIWFPEQFSRDLRLWSVVVHSVTSVLAILSLVAHIYMSVFVARGSLRAMTTGKVSEAWARHHHAAWAEKKLHPPA